MATEVLFKKQMQGVKVTADSLVVATFVSLYAMDTISEVSWFEGFSAFGNSYVVNIYTQYMKIVAGLIASFLSRFIILSAANQKKELIELEQPLLIIILLLISSVMLSCGNFVLLLLALESFSLILYLLPAQGRDHGGITASFKYFSFGTFGSILIF